MNYLKQLLLVLGFCLLWVQPAWANRESDLLQQMMDDGVFNMSLKQERVYLQPVKEGKGSATVTFYKVLANNGLHWETTIKLKGSNYEKPFLEMSPQFRYQLDLEDLQSSYYMAGIRYPSKLLQENIGVNNADGSFLVANNWNGGMVADLKTHRFVNKTTRSYQVNVYKGPYTLSVYTAAWPPDHKRRASMEYVMSQEKAEAYVMAVARIAYGYLEPKLSNPLSGLIPGLGAQNTPQTNPQTGQVDKPQQGEVAQPDPQTEEQAREVQQRAAAAATAAGLVLILINALTSAAQNMGGGLLSAAQTAVESAVHEADRVGQDLENADHITETVVNTGHIDPHDEVSADTMEDLARNPDSEGQLFADERLTNADVIEEIPEAEQITDIKADPASAFGGEQQVKADPASAFVGDNQVKADPYSAFANPPALIDPYYPQDGPLIVQDGTYIGGNVGDVWVDGKWVSYDDAQKYIGELNAEIRARKAESAAFWQESMKVGQQALDRMHANNEREAFEIFSRQQLEQALQNREDFLNQRAVNGLQRAVENLDDSAEKIEIEAEMDQLLADGNVEGAKDLYREVLGQTIQATSDEAYWEQWKATGYHAAEMGAWATQVASQTALTVMGGRVVASGAKLAGAAATGLLSGSMQGAESAATVITQGGNSTQALKAGAQGFLSGTVSNGAGVMVNVPGASRLRKVLLPAAGDAVGTYIETGDAKTALKAGGVSMLSGTVGQGVDAIDNKVLHHTTGMYVSGLTGGAQSVVRGGSFVEGFKQGVAADAIARGTTPVFDKMGARRIGFETDVTDAVGRMKAAAKETIPLEGQSKTVQDMMDDTHTQLIQERQSDGTYVDREIKVSNGLKGLDQLRDTRGSRTAKQAPPDVQEVIINTRNKQIYEPSNQRTIDTVTQRLHEHGKLQPGDQVVMDNFSTPGETPSVGADRDARMVILRPHPDHPNDMSKATQIEIEPHLWENDAYRDFYEHTTAMAQAHGREINNPEHYPEFQRVREQFEPMKGADSIDQMHPNVVEQMRSRGMSDAEILARSGLTDEQIDHRAWALMHNQLFTNKYHSEASIDNSDQARRVVWRSDIEEHSSLTNMLSARNEARELGQDFDTPLSVSPENVTPPALDTAKGRSTLSDPEGFGRMWKEKSEIYVHVENAPEAVAQSQKGVSILMAQRNGLRESGHTVPPLSPELNAAAVNILEAPVGVKATPEDMADLNNRLKALGFGSNEGSSGGGSGHDHQYSAINDAMYKLASQSENLKYAQPHNGDPDVASSYTITQATLSGIAASQVRTETLSEEISHGSIR